MSKYIWTWLYGSWMRIRRSVTSGPVIFLKWPLDVWKCCSVPWGERGLHAVWTCWDAFTAEKEREQSRHGKMLYFWEPEQERKFEYTKLRYFYEKYQLIRENLIILFDRYYKPQIGWQQMYIYYIPAIYRASSLKNKYAELCSIKAYSFLNLKINLTDPKLWMVIHIIVASAV